MAAKILLYWGISCWSIGALFSLLRWKGSSEVLLVGLGMLALGYIMRFMKKTQRGVLDVIKLLFVLLFVLSYISSFLNWAMPFGIDNFFPILLNVVLLIILALSLRQSQKTGEKPSWLPLIWNPIFPGILLVIVLASIMKVMHLQGADIMLLVGFVLFSLYFLKLPFVKPRNQSDS